MRIMNSTCTNKLEVRGPLKSLSLFKKKAIHRNTTVNGIAFTFLFSMDSLFPNPLNRRMESTYISSDGALVTKVMSDWGLTNWGTASTSNFAEVENNGGRYCVEFDSAYAPPLLALRKISRDFPQLSFDVFFAGHNNGFSGFIVFKNGEVADIAYVENKGHEGVVWKQLNMDTMHAPIGLFARYQREGNYVVTRTTDGYSIRPTDLKCNVVAMVPEKPASVPCDSSVNIFMDSDDFETLFEFSD